MSVLPASESALEFLATCAARLQTSWVVTAGAGAGLGERLSLTFERGEIGGEGCAGRLSVAGKFSLTRSLPNDPASSLVLTGTYDRAHNAVHGTAEGRGRLAGGSGPFQLELQVPDIQMTVEQEEAERASQRSAAVTDYNKQREVALSADLGAPGTDLIATWTALYVYGSGRSDTVKDILIRVVGSGNGAALSGSGSDSQGDYDWSGTLAGGEFTLVKQYLGAHAIAHSGTYDRATGTVKGTWSIKGTRASGGFQMSEQVGRRVNGVSMGDAAKSGGEAAPQTGALTPATIADTVWSVVYVYASGRSDELRDCTLRLVRGRISGSGEDGLGKFRWAGELAADGKIIVDKEYLGQHTVRHTGALTHTGDATVAKGSWSVPNTRAVGGFMMTERVNMRRGVPEVFTTALGTVGQPVIVTMDIDYMYGSGDSEEARGIRLQLTGSAISGRGSDAVGPCEWSGHIRGAEAEIVKRYTGKHDIVHRGAYNADKGSIKGEWHIPGTDVKGTFVMEERMVERKVQKGGGGEVAEVLAAGGARGVAVPSMETASMERARSLPPLHTVKDEVVTVWRGHQIIGSSQTAELELRLAFAPGAGGIAVSGKGSDDAGGDFVIAGKLDPKTLVLDMKKTYKTHDMDFSCNYSPEDSSLKGKWSMTMMKATGQVELMEVPEKRLG